jgi:xanthine dehydrogenase iron-sulfur cluster and FAD-binding subunit A
VVVVVVVVMMMMIASFTGVEVKFKNMVYPVLIQPSQILELTSVATNSSGIRVGAAVTLNDMQQALRNEIESQPGTHTTIMFMDGSSSVN